MTACEFNNFCTEKFNLLFDEAKQSDEIKYFSSFFPLYKENQLKCISYVPEQELQEVFELINDFNPVCESEEIRIKTKTRTRLLLYCHIIEADYIYMVIYNLLNTIKKLEYSSTIKYKNKKNEMIEAEHPFQKIKSIKEIDDLNDYKISDIFDNVFFNQIRNGFSHSQYSLDKSGDFYITKYISPASSYVAKNADKQQYYTSSEIYEIYKKTIIYFNTFTTCYKNHILPYLDGQPHATVFGNIYYDSNHGWGFNK